LQGLSINNGSGAVHINAKNFARWGWLFLNKGNWDGVQLLSKKWINEAASVQVSSTIPVADTDRKDTEGSGCYGFNWWVNCKKADGNLKLPGAPEGIFWASELNNNRCFVIPQWNMVVVRMGTDGNIDNADEVYGTFIEMLGDALVD